MSYAEELIEQFHQSAEFKTVKNFVIDQSCEVDGSVFEAPDSPIKPIAFRRFCNFMISVHFDNMVRHNGGVTVQGEGVQVRTQKNESGDMQYFAAPVLQNAVQ